MKKNIFIIILNYCEKDWMYNIQEIILRFRKCVKVNKQGCFLFLTVYVNRWTQFNISWKKTTERFVNRTYYDYL